MKQQYYEDLNEREKLIFNSIETMLLDCLTRDRRIILLDLILKKHKGELK